MAIDLRQSTASQEIPLGYFVDSTDGNTEKTGLTIANTDIKIWKTGATTLANKNSGGATHISNGIYYAVLDATDTDTIGPLVIFVHVSGALAVRLECNVLDEAVYDVKYGTTAPSTFAAGGNVNTSTISNNAITAASIASDAVTEIQSGLSTLDAAGVRSAVGLASANLDTQLDAIPTAAENASQVRTELTTELGRIDVAVSTRLASASYTAPLDAAGTRSAIGLVSANLDTQLSTIDTNVDSILVDTGTDIPASISTIDTVVDAIKLKTDNLPASPANETTVAAVKAKTDSLTFTVAGHVDANLQLINDTELTGNGSTIPWGPA